MACLTGDSSEPRGFIVWGLGGFWFRIIGFRLMGFAEFGFKVNNVSCIARLVGFRADEFKRDCNPAVLRLEPKPQTLI